VKSSYNFLTKAS